MPYEVNRHNVFAKHLDSKQIMDQGSVSSLYASSMASSFFFEKLPRKLLSEILAMITGKSFYDILSALIPLYVAMALPYVSMKRWKVFTPEQCLGINRFIAADTLQKVVILVALGLWKSFDKNDKLDLKITVFSLSSLPNTLVIGVPLLGAMYGEDAKTLMVQVMVPQFLVWCTVMLVMYEYRAAKALIAEQFPQKAASIVSMKVDSDVISLDCRQPLETHSEVGEDGKLHVSLRRSTSTKSSARIIAPHIFFLDSFQETIQTTQRNINSRRNSCHVASFREERMKRSNLENGEMVMRSEESKPIQKKRLGRSKSTSCVSAMNPSFFSFPLENGSVSDSWKVANIEVSLEEALEASTHVDQDLQEITDVVGCAENNTQMPPASVVTRLILIMVWRKLIRNPNTYSSIIGLIWSLLSFRWEFEMPKVVANSIKIISDVGSGMAMFSLGLFMALQPKIITCRKSHAFFSMAIRFLAAPLVMAATSFSIGIRGNLLRVCILQAALPQAIVSFVFAKEYNVHAELFSTVVIFGTIISLPILIVYYILLGL